MRTLPDAPLSKGGCAYESEVKGGAELAGGDIPAMTNQAPAKKAVPQIVFAFGPDTRPSFSSDSESPESDCAASARRVLSARGMAATRMQQVESTKLTIALLGMITT